MAKQRSNVPQFGNWENQNNVPYTIYFDKARKTRGGKMINPNDPQENPDMFPTTDPSPFAPPPAKPMTRREESIGRGAVRPTPPEHRVRKEEFDFRQLGNSPAQNENMGQRLTNESSYGGRGQRPARPARPSAGSERSFEQSPLHLNNNQAKVTGGTPGRARPRAARDESPDRSAAVPRFGVWNENDPQSAENFTHIFNKVREERIVGTGTAANTTPKHSSYPIHNPTSNEPKKCCFPWW